MAEVSGQVTATATDGKHGFPSDVELAKVVFPLPLQVNEKFMTDTENVSPVATQGNLIKLFIDHSQDLLKRNGHLAIVDKKKEPYAGGLKFVERKRFMKDRIYVLQVRKCMARISLVLNTAIHGSLTNIC